jgi:hypothetical protein
MPKPQTEALQPVEVPSSSTGQAAAAVRWNAALWTIGSGLTSGGFVDYFAQELGAFGFTLALIATTPELAGLAGVGYRQFKPLSGGRQRMWLIGTILSRFLLMGLPLAGLLASNSVAMPALVLLWCSLFLAGLLNGLASTAFFSWLGSLAGYKRGEFLGKRQLVVLLFQLIVPLAGAYFRDWTRSANTTGTTWLLVYAGVFAAGIGLQLLSVLAMRRIPAMEIDDQQVEWTLRLTPQLNRALDNKLVSPAMWLIIHAVLLGAANGLTQSVISQYQFKELQMPLFARYLLFDLMILVQIGTTWWAMGQIDAGRCSRPLFWGALLASFGILFYALAGKENWWWVLIFSSICWGGFGAVKVAGPALAIKLSGARDAGPLLAWLRVVPGFAAGVTGLLGGLLLMQDFGPLPGLSAWSTWMTEYQILFMLSFVGRWIAAFLVTMIVEPKIAESLAAEDLTRSVNSSEKDL